MPQLNVALVPAPDQVVVRLTGDADLSDGAAGRRRPGRRPRACGTRQVVVDVAGVRFWDFSGLHALAEFTGDLAADGRACRIVGRAPGTRRLIGMAEPRRPTCELDGPLRAPRRRAARTPAGRGRPPAVRWAGTP